MSAPEVHGLPAETSQCSLQGGLPGILSCLKAEGVREDKNAKSGSDGNLTASSDSSLLQMPREEYICSQNMLIFWHNADWPTDVSFEPALDRGAGQLREA